MKNRKPTMNTLHTHCISDMAYFCNFGSEGSSYHCHVDFYEFCLVVSGSYQHSYLGVETELQLGNLIFFRPGESHELIANSPSSTHYSVIIKDSYFQEYCTRHMDHAEQIFSTPFIQKRIASSEFAYLIHLASAIVRSASADRLPIVNQFLSNALFFCFETMPNVTDNTVHIYAVDLLKIFDSYHMLDAEISDIYKLYPISAKSLISDFKKMTGQTIVGYRNQKRIEYAAHLLKEENYSITTIANILHIASLGYFAKQFHKQYGMTPKEYQIQYRKKVEK